MPSTQHAWPRRIAVRGLETLLFHAVLATWAQRGGPDFRAASLALDPSLSTCPVEFFWGCSSFLPAQALSGLGMSPQWTVFWIGFAWLAVGWTIFSEAFRERFEGVVSRWLFLAFGGLVVSLVLSRYPLSPSYTGPSVMVVGIFGALAGLARAVIARKPSKHALGETLIFGLGCGTVASWGAPYLLFLSPFFGRVRQADPPPGLGRKVVAATILSWMAFLVLKVRYPHSSAGVSDGGWIWLGRLWLFGHSGEALAGAFGLEGFLVRFPGAGLLLGLATGWFLFDLAQSAWERGAGRTVPAQLVLYSLPLGLWVLLLGLNYREAKPASDSIQETGRMIAARTLVWMAPPATHCLAAGSFFDRALFLQTWEGLRPDTSFQKVEFDGPTDPLQERAERSLTASDRPTLFTTGENWVRVESEPIDFVPYYLLNATTEVYTATPSFFIGNNPVQATDQPILTWFGQRLPIEVGSGERLSPGIRGWGYNGEHFLLYRDHSPSPWEPMREGWRASYYGFVLGRDRASWGLRKTARPAVSIRDFYR